MASRFASLDSCWIQPPRETTRYLSRSSSAAALTSYGQPRQHGTQHRLLLYTEPCKTQRTSSCAWTPAAVPYSHPTEAHIKFSPARTKHSRLTCGAEVIVSADRLKPAYTLDEGQHGTKKTKPPVPAAIPSTPAATPKTTRCGRRMQFPARFTT
jgi:hypothetical protein